jgi:hypothetical protein
MSRKPKTVPVGNIAVSPITAKERKELDKRIKKRHERLRKRFRETHGKVVDWVSHYVEEGSLYVCIRFKDETDFSLQFSPQIVTDGIDLSDISTGDHEIIREYYPAAGRRTDRFDIKAHVRIPIVSKRASVG